MAADRMRRVNEAVKEVLSTHIAGDLRDPRIGFVTVTSVETSPDLRRARVYVSVLGTEEERTRSLEVTVVDDDLSGARDSPAVPCPRGEVEHAMHRLDAVGREQLSNQHRLRFVRDDGQPDEVVAHNRCPNIHRCPSGSSAV